MTKTQALRQAAANLKRKQRGRDALAFDFLAKFTKPASIQTTPVFRAQWMDLVGKDFRH